MQSGEWLQLILVQRIASNPDGVSIRPHHEAGRDRLIWLSNECW